MDSKPDEARVFQWLESQGLLPERLRREEREHDNPDFKVSGPRGELLLCEVKSLRRHCRLCCIAERVRSDI